MNLSHCSSSSSTTMIRDLRLRIVVGSLRGGKLFASTTKVFISTGLPPSVSTSTFTASAHNSTPQFAPLLQHPPMAHASASLSGRKRDPPALTFGFTVPPTIRLERSTLAGRRGRSKPSASTVGGVGTGGKSMHKTRPVVGHIAGATAPFSNALT